MAIREEDFSSVIDKLAELKKRGVKDIRRYLKQRPQLVAELASQVRISDVNKEATKIFGVISKDQLPLNLSGYFIDTSATMFIETLANLAEGKPNFSYENVNTKVDGSLINVIVYVSVTPGHEQDLSKVLVSIIDITSLKKAEEDLRRKNLMQEKIVALGRELAASMDLEVICRTVERYIRSMVSCSVLGISMYDPEKSILTPIYFSKDEKSIDLEKIPPRHISPGQSTEELYRSIALKTPVIVKPVDSGIKSRSSKRHNNSDSVIYIPMLAEDKVMGLIELRNEYQNACSEEYIDWLSVVANQLGLAIQNARLNEDILRELTERKRAETEIRQNLAELEMLYDNALAVNQLLDPDEVGKAMIALFTRYFPMHHTVIRLRVDNTDDLRIAAFYVPGLKASEREKVAKRFAQSVSKVGQGLSGWSVKTGQPIRVGDVSSDPHYVDTYPGIRSGIYIPIMSAKQILGSIAIESEMPDAFDERDERLLTTIANQAAIAFENARLYQEVQKELEERKSTEAALRVSQGRLQSILDNTSARIYIKDLDGRFVLVNKAMSKYYKLSAEKMVGLSEYDISTPEEAEQFYRNDQIVAQKRAPTTFEENLFLNGEKHTHISFKFPLWNEDGTISGIGGITTDITEQKKNEEQVYLLSYAIEQSPVSVALTDYSGNLEYANKQFLKGANSELEEIKGKYLRDLNPDLISTGEYKALFKTIQAGSEWHGEYQNIGGDGKAFWESISISPVFNSQGKITHFLEIIEDITARKEAELAMIRLNTELEDRVKQRTEELRTANFSLEKASRLKDEFLASMSHELRTPLTGVLGLSEALQKGIYGPLNEKQMNILFTIEEGGRHLLNLINDILDLSKIEAGKTELQFNLADVDEICQASMRMVKQIALSKSQKVSFSQSPSEMMIYADPRRLKQILVNLLGNAVKFTPENGELGLEVNGDEVADMILFTVWDKGIGIDPKNKEKLFQPFVQLDSSLSRSYAGTGLGLSLVDRLTHLHGGSVVVNSAPGQGSRFTVSIPWKKKKIDEITTAGSNTANLSGYTPIKSRSQPELGLIVLIDDNEINNGMLSDYLSFQGYKVETALDSKQGLDLIVKKKPKLVLMDIQMPGIDGLEAIRILRAMTTEFAKTPIIALTALAMEEDRQRCLDAGADDYIAKPVNLNELSSKIKRLMEKSK